MYERKMPIKKRSGLDLTFFLVEGKWKRDILFCLVNGIRRPSEMQKHLAGVYANPRVLRQQLTELTKYGLIYKVVDDMPLKVSYFLTDIGLELIPLFNKMSEWGDKYEKINRNKLENESLIFLS